MRLSEMLEGSDSIVVRFYTSFLALHLIILANSSSKKQVRQIAYIPYSDVQDLHWPSQLPLSKP